MSRLACVLGLLGVSLACFVGEAAPPAHATSKATTGVKVIRGWVRLSASTPVRGARVTLETTAGKPIATLSGDGPRITNKAGAFSIRTAALPARFVVVARGGKAAGKAMTAPFRAKVFGHHPLDLVRLNLLTTVAATRQMRHPNERYNATLARVRQLLSIPGWHSLDRDASASPEYFDGVRFATYARAHGGMTAFLARIQRELDSAHPAARDFHGVRPTPAPGRGLAAAGRSADEADLAGDLLGALGDSVEGKIADTLLGSVLSAIGLDGGDPNAEVLNQIKGVQDQLNIVEQGLVSLSSDLNNDINALSSQVTQASYNATANTLNPYKTVIDTATGNLQYFVDNPTEPSNAQTAESTLQSIRTNLVPFASAYNTALAVGAPGTGSLLTIAQQNFYASAKLNQPLIGGSGLSQQAQDVYQYYALYEAQLVELLVESDRDNNVSAKAILQRDIAPAQGSPGPPISPGYLANWRAEILPPVPPFSFADLRTGRIWSLLLPASLGCNASIATLGGMWTAAMVGLVAPDSGETPILCTFPIGGYSMPAMADLLALTAGWKSAPAKDGSRPADVLAWLTTQTGPTAPQTGPSAIPAFIGTVQPAVSFQHGPYVRSVPNGTPWAFWSSDCSFDGNVYLFSVDYLLNPPVGVSAGKFTSCQILDLATGTTTTECVADFDSFDGTGGCERPLDVNNRYTGPVSAYPCAPCGKDAYGYTVAGGIQLDYFHPNLVLGWRALNTGERYWLAP